MASHVVLDLLYRLSTLTHLQQRLEALESSS